MKYYEKLIDKRVFTYKDILEITGNKGATNSLLFEYKKRGYIKSIKRNLYTAISLETKQPIANKFEIGSSITESSYISHHSAFSYYGMTNQVFNEVYVSSEKRFNDFEFEGITYRFIQSKFSNGIFKPIENNLVKVTDIERTVVDSIKDFEKVAGFEELLRCLDMITYLDEDKIINYLRLYNLQMLYQKTGYLLEQYKDNIQLSDNFFEFCQKNIKKSTRYLCKNLRKEELEFNNKWQLVVPKDMLSIKEQGGNDFV